MLGSANSQLGNILFSEKTFLNRKLTYNVLQVGSICILASLDAFFEYMDLTPFNGEWSQKGKANTSPVKHKDEGGDTRRLSEIQAEERPLAFKGLDTTLGIIDSRYIQHCCPLLMVRPHLFSVAIATYLLGSPWGCEDVDYPRFCLSMVSEI